MVAGGARDAVGLLGAKLYYLAEHATSLTWRDFGGMGFTWYGGMIAGTIAVLVVIRRRRLPLGLVSGLVAVPLSLAYGIGRLGCLLAGDGTYGRPTTVPWGMTFPHGTMPTTVAVHPTPLYEALAAFAIAGLLMWLGQRVPPPAVFASYLVLSGLARLLVEFVRINPPALFGLTQPQWWSALLVVVGATILVSRQRPLHVRGAQ
jgi:phosphatidylglycerol---prolipoprotein diacylglyceryl transferase